MQDIGFKLSRTAAVIVILLAACVGSAWASGYAGGVPWQVGDIIVCFGTGTCNVLRMVNNTPILLDQFTDNLGGSTYGVAVNNTLHVVATDDMGGSKVVVYSIGSLNVNANPPTPVAHTPVLYPGNSNPYYDTSGTNSGSMVRAVAINNAGNIFVLNSTGTSGPNIVEIGPGPGQTPVATFPLSGCKDSLNNPIAITQAVSMDLSSAADTAYVTSGLSGDGAQGKILQLNFSNGNCTTFADFGSGVTLYGIKDIPANALTKLQAGVRVPQSCNGTPCPTDESILVVAQGFTDTANETGELTGNPAYDPDAINICTNQSQQNSPPVSCALLLDSTPFPLGSLWKASTQYPLSAPILDPSLHVQTVYIAGTSGLDEPPFSSTGGKVIDNAVIWTNQGQPPWKMDSSFTSTPFPGTYIVDSNSNLQTVSTSGISGHSAPTWQGSGQTVDGLQWSDLGPQTRVMSSPSPISMGSLVSDPSTHAQQVIQAGETGSGALPAGGWNDSGGRTVEGVTWTESNPTWMGNTKFGVGTLIIDNSFHVQQVQQAGTSVSGNTAPTFNEGTTDDNTVTWVDIGQAVWRPSFGYGSNAIILDSRGHVQQVTAAGLSGAGPNPPNFLDDGTSTSDNGVTWADRGALSGNATFTWQPSNPYAQNAEIIDGGIVIPGTQTVVTTASESGNTVTLTASNFPAAFNPGNMITVSGCAPSGYNGTFPIASVSGGTSLTYLDSATPLGLGSGCSVQAANANVGLVAVAGTSGFGIQTPAFVDGGTVVDNAVTWADLGQAVWRPNFSYGLNAIILDGAGNVQQVTQAGTTGSTMPDFSSNPTTDGSVQWTNQGALLGSAFQWQASYTYALNAMIIDSNNHVQLATNAGQSGNSNPPAFADGGSVVDGLIWADQAQPVWTANHLYSAVAGPIPIPGTYIVDSNNHLEEVTTPGISGPEPHPLWPSNGGTTIDGLIWADVGVWQNNHQYFALFQPNVFVAGTAVGDSNGHVHTVVATGTSGPGPTTPTPAWNDTNGTNNNLTAAGITIDNAVIWTESHPMWQATHTYTVGNPDTLIIDTNNNVQLVTNDDPHSVGTSAISGPSQPAGHNAWNTTTNPPGKTIDGLEWINQAPPATSVVARYPVKNSPTPTLQGLALDPLVADCTGSNCSRGVQPPTISNFWLADNGSAKFYKLDFATGAGGIPTALNGAPNCPGTSQQSQESQQCANYVSFAQGGIQGIGIYGGEGSNQPDLTKVLAGTGGTSQTAFFPLPNDGVTSNTNSLTLSLYNNNNQSLAPLPPFAVYGSSVPLGSCFFDGTPSLPCTGTTAGGSNAVVWKNDIPLPSSGLLRLDPSAQTGQTLAYSFDVPPAFQSINNNVFVDSFYNTTTGVGLDLPSGRYPSSTGIGTPVNANGQQPTDFGCTYQSPTPKCFKNPGTIPVKFVCSKLPGVSLQNFASTIPYGPRLQIISPATAPPAQFCTGAAPNEANATTISGGKAPNVGICPTQLPSSNGKTTYRFDSSALDWVFNWSVPSTSTRKTYHVCTYDDSHNAKTFCVDVTVASSCP